MKFRIQPLAWAASLALLAAAPAQAQVYGSMANFDAVNDTGYVAHGFEIRIEDAAYGDPSRNLIESIFGYDRDFGVPADSVERYGAPDIIQTPGVGITIRYRATFAAGVWSVGTPSGLYPGAGDSCWPLGDPQYASGQLSCDHFGVGTYGTPAKTSYSWLVDTGGNSGVLTPVAAGLPPVVFAYAPPVVVNGVQQAAEVQAHVEAEHPEDNPVGPAYWVKIFAKKVDHDVAVADLMKGPNFNDVPGEDEVEAEYAIFQAGGENEVAKALLKLDPADAGAVLRFEFYKYIGDFKADGSTNCSGGGGGGGGGNGGGHNGPDNCGGLGAFVGRQMAAFNQVQDPLAPGVAPPVQVLAVPEPGSWALMAAGLGLVGLRRRQARNR
jgi:PEP-CTERM motif